MCSIMRSFWWQSSREGKGIPSVAWDKLCRPKQEGELGFRELGSFNQVLLAKHGWHLLQNPNLLVAKVLKHQYFLNRDFMDASFGTNPSFG